MGQREGSMPKVIQNSRSLSNKLGQLIEYRELLIIWVFREIRARYRQSVLGFGWALVVPVVQMLVISVVFGNFLGISSGDVPYPLFSYTALLPWTLFSASILAAVPSVSHNIDLVTKIYFPREVLPISAILARLVDFAIASLVFVILLIFYRAEVYITILFVPVLLLVQIILAIGIGLLGAAMNVFLRDISFAIVLIMQIWMYATPVIYPQTMVPEKWRMIYSINPMVGIIESYRRVVLYGLPPDYPQLAYSSVVALVSIIFGYLFFKKVEMSMSDVI